jgi:signal transduction histidine kinase/ligand-binding sensor domain-containing protein/DNA-binding response OmpR family regulator
MRNLFSLAFILLFFFIEGYTQKQEIAFENISTSNGLSKNFITNIIHDHRGYLWFGGIGLNRYDGYFVKNYFHHPSDTTSLTSNLIMKMLEDRFGNIWILTSEGLNKYNRQTDCFYRFYYIDSESNTKKYFKSLQEITLFEDKGGCLNVIMENKFYSLPINSESTVFEQKRINIDLWQYQYVYADGDQMVWLADTANLFCYDPVKDSVISTKKNVLLQKNIAEIVKDGQFLYICYYDASYQVLSLTNGTLSYYDVAKGNTESYLDALQPSFLPNVQGKVWFGTPNGIVEFNPSEGTRGVIKNEFNNAASLSNDNIQEIYKDHNGLIWIGTLEGGVNKYDTRKKKFNSIKENSLPNSLTNNLVNAFFEDKSGKIWVGTDKGGLNLYDPITGTCEAFLHQESNPRSLSNNTVTSLATDEQNNIWVATFGGGLNRFDKTTRSFVHYKSDPTQPNSLAWDKIKSLHSDQQNKLWIGLHWNQYSGVDVLDRIQNGFTHFKHLAEDPESILDNSCEVIFSDSKGRIWMGFTGAGLDCYDPKSNKFTHYPENRTENGKLSSGYVVSVFEDRDGIMWFGTVDGGLFQLSRDEKTFVKYGLAEGLPDESVMAIQGDENGNLWLGTAKGLVRYNPKKKEFKTYDVSDGLPTNEFRRGAMVSSTGWFYFSTTKGFIYFKPNEIMDNPDPPLVEITNFRIFNQQVDFRQKGAPINKPIDEVHQLTLNHKQSIFSFEFVALNYSSTNKNQYAYKLEGFEKDWNYVGTNRSATYTNLPDGKYTFKVIASNNDGIWNTEGKAIEVIILPPWWKTWWFRISIILFTIGVTISWIQYRTRQLKLRSKLLAKLVKEKTIALEEQSEILRMQNLQLEESNEALAAQKLEISRQKDDIERIAGELNTLNEQKMKFFMNISHEFRTPLTLILGPLDHTLKNLGSLDQTIQKQLVMVHRNANRLLRLINQLLDIRKLDSGSMHLKLMKGDVIVFIRDIYESFNYLAKRHNMSCHFRCNLENFPAIFDHDILEKILYNLISNAFKYTPDYREIMIDLAIEETNQSAFFADLGETTSYIRFSVIDQGIGIPNDKLDKVFDRFYRIEAAGMRKQGGTGIGLSLTKELVDLHHGSISVSSVEGKGSKFTVVLPIGSNNIDTYDSLPNSDFDEDNKYPHIKLEDEYITELDLGREEQDKLVAGKRKQLIMVVDDNEDVRQFIKNHIAEKYRVIEAENGFVALEMAKEKMPNLIISDVMMPQMDGLEFCRQIKTNENTSHIPVIMLTARISEQDQILGLENGADDYLVKPFNIDILLLKIQNQFTLRKQLTDRFRKEIGISPKEIALTSVDEEIMDKLLRIVENQISNEDLNPGLLASELGLSRTLLYTKLKALTGQSVNEFIQMIRLKRAAQLLKSKNMPVSEVCFQVGFKDPSHFAKSFKKLFGISPKEYIG